jgi:phage-related minor tail protein
VAVGTDVGYYTLPVILSFDGVEKNVNSKLGKAFGDVGKRSSKAFADGTEVDLKRATDAYGKLRDRAADALGKVRVEEEKLKKARDGGKTDQIAAAEERLSKARRDSTRINREAIASYGELEAAQKRLADSSGGLLSKLKNVGGAASSSGGEAASGFVAGFGGPIAALGSKAGPVGIALAATAGLGLLAGKALGDQILAGLDQLQGQANVAAKLGLSAEQIKPIAKAAADAYAQNFGESVEGNLDAARAAIQGGLLDPNATQADIEKVVAQLNTVATVTGESIPNAVRTAQQAVRTGLAQDVTSAFDLIVKAQQSGLNVSEDLFDTLNEYGTQFRKLGLDGPEALGLIAQAVQGGARDTDTAADALKEFSIRSIDGSKLTGQAYKDLGLSFKGTTEAFAAGGETAKATFQEVINRIAAVEDPAKRAQIQVALFGTKAEDLGNAVNAMNLDTAVAQLGQVEGATEQAANTLGGTGASSIESARRNIEVAVDTMQQGLATAFGPALEKVANWVVANQDKIVGFFITLGHAAISASEFIVRSVGDIMSTIGQIVQPFGDIQGFMLKFQAWQAEIRGDTETAEQLRKQAEEAFGFGEGLTAAGEAMKNYDAKDLHKSLDETAGKAKAAAGETGGLVESLDQLRKQQFFEAFGKPMPAVSGASGSIGVRGDVAGLNLSTVEVSAQQFANNCISASARIILSATDKVLSEVDIDQVIARGGSIDSLAAGLNKLNPAGKYVPLAGSGGSPEAMFAAIKESIDKGIGSVLNVAPGSSLGGTTFDYGHFIAVTGYDPKTGRINLSDTADGSVYSVSPGEAFQASQGRGIVAGTGIGRTPAAASSTPSRPVPVTIANPSATPMPALPSAVTSAMPTATAGMSPIDISQLTAGSQALTNAYGPGYEAGIGTPGRNEYGDVGYFRTDARALREAQQRADDAAYAITEADAAAQAAREARAALDDTPNVDATQIAGADEAVRDAERRAALARREAADAATDAAEVAKGEFTKAKEVAKEPKKTAAGGSDSGLGALGSIASSFLEETFGFGSLLPALDSFAPLQMADTLLGAFDWSTMGFSPEAQAAKAAAQGTSGDAFGIPNIAAPPMPQGSAHTGGGGAPGPTIVNVDQSQNFSNSPLGWDPVEVNKERDRNINRAPRLPIGMGN